MDYGKVWRAKIWNWKILMDSITFILNGKLLLLLLSRFSHVRLCDPIDSSPPSSPVPGIPQARTRKWIAISFSNAWKWKVKVKSLSRVQPSATPRTAAFQAPPSMGFSRQEYWSGVPSPSLKSVLGAFLNVIWGLNYQKYPQHYTKPLNVLSTHP